MDTGQIKKNWDTGFEKLIHTAQAAKPGFDFEDVHEFRLAFKKLRTFLRVINNNRKKQKLSLPKEISYLYRSFGEIRNLQLQLNTITEKYPDAAKRPMEYVNLLGTELQKKIQFLNSISVPIEKIRKEMKKNRKTLPRKFSKKAQLKFLRKKIEKAGGLFLKAKTDSGFHEIRKILKDIHNVSRLFTECKEPKAASEARESILDDLGTYQDLRIRVFYLKPKYLNQLNASEKPELLSLKASIQKEKQALRKIIISRLLKPDWQETPVI